MAVITPVVTVLLHVVLKGFHHVPTYLFSPLATLMMFVLSNFLIMSAAIEFPHSNYEFETNELDDINVIPYFLSSVLHALFDDSVRDNCFETFADEECLLSYKFFEVLLICLYYYSISNILDFVRVWKANTLVITCDDDVVGYITFDGTKWNQVIFDHVVGHTAEDDDGDDDSSQDNE